jgi:hypothetical protein
VLVALLLGLKVVGSWVLVCGIGIRVGIRIESGTVRTLSPWEILGVCWVEDKSGGCER